MRICGSSAAISGTVGVQGSGYSSSLRGYRQSCAILELLIILCTNGSRAVAGAGKLPGAYCCSLARRSATGINRTTPRFLNSKKSSRQPTFRLA